MAFGKSSLQWKFHTNLKSIVKKKSKCCNSHAECSNIMKFSVQTNLNIKISIMGSISAKLEDWRVLHL